jgi:hypothetical protein
VLHVDSGLARKHLTKLARFARDKYSNLLRKIANYGVKSFIKLGQKLEMDLERLLRTNYEGITRDKFHKHFTAVNRDHVSRAGSWPYPQTLEKA